MRKFATAKSALIVGVGILSAATLIARENWSSLGGDWADQNSGGVVPVVSTSSLEFVDSDPPSADDFPSVRIVGDCPGPVELQVTNASPFSLVAFIYSLTPGFTTIGRGTCEGTVLPLGGQPVLLAVEFTDSNGEAVFEGIAPAGVCGRVHLMVLDLYDCTPSSPVVLAPSAFTQVNSGTFNMGSPVSEPGREVDEPLHEVTLTNSFFLSTHEVTQNEWAVVMGTTPSEFPGCDDCPVENVSWHDAVEFCNALSARDGFQPAYEITANEVIWNQARNGFRLPTEAEWEYACRAGSSTAFYNGDITDLSCSDPNLDQIGWYCGNSADVPHEVAGKNANAWDFYDMSGNVWEWCWDWYDAYPSEAVTDPTGPESGAKRVSRGGRSKSDASFCRSAQRNENSPDFRSGGIGFRVAQWVPTSNQGPEAEIIRPVDGTDFAYDAVIELEGTGTDPEQGPLEGMDLIWTSDLEGWLGNGTDPVVPAEVMRGGSHVITLTAVDNASLTGTDQVTITLAHNEPPEVEITKPADGSSYAYDASITLEGAATDPEYGDLTGESLVWSSNWEGPVGTGNIVELDSQVLRPGVHTIKLTAKDKSDLPGSAEVTVTVLENQAPVPVITSPADGATYNYDAPMTLAGLATDAEDGDLPGESLVWTSNINGYLGTGASVELAGEALSPGAHTITLTAKDKSGLPGNAEVSVTVLENQAPVAEIISPEDGSSYAFDAPIELMGSATDPEDGPLTGSSLVWTSSVAGELGTGENVSLDGGALLSGVHTITLTATDRGSKTGATSVSITVEPNAPPVVEILSPIDGSSYAQSSEVSLEGAATDPEDGDLTGESLVWTSSLDGQLGTGTPVTLAGGTLSAGAHAIRLTATDSGFVTGAAEVNITVLENQPPDVSILEPSDGDTLSYDVPISLAGSADDPEDGELAGAALVWKVDGEEVGTGADLELSVGTVLPGPHTVTLTATDKGSLSATASVDITVETSSNLAPQVSIGAPFDGGNYGVGSLIWLSGSALDPEDGALSGESLVWTSDVDDTLGTGENVPLPGGSLTLGAHQITLTATDSGTLSSSGTVGITVYEDEVPLTVARWTFNLDDARDDTGGGRDGTGFGVTYTDGVLGRAADFDGSAHIEVADDVDVFDPTGPFSVQAWMKSSGGMDDDYFIVMDKSHGFGDYTGWFLQGRTSDGSIYFGFGNGSDFPPSASAPGVVDGEWHHVVGVFTGSAVEIYVDGVLKDTQSMSLVPAGNDRPLVMGRSRSESDRRYYNGLLDDMAYWNTALNIVQIGSLYRDGIPPVIYVPADYPTIQQAIQAAQNGDVIQVAAGLYVEKIDFLGKAISVVGAGSALSVIDVSGVSTGAGRVVTFKNNEGPSSVLAGFKLTGGKARRGAGVFCSYASATIVQCSIMGNTADDGAGVYCTRSSNPTISECTITGNTATLYSGGGIECAGSSPVISGCRISGNTAAYSGGGIMSRGSHPTLVNCVISGNSAPDFRGGGLYLLDSSPNIMNCTFSGNLAGIEGGGMFCLDSSPWVGNTIFWNDLPEEIIVGDDSDPLFAYCDIEGGWVGKNNLDRDPRFVNGANGDFHLSAGSPCINTGTIRWSPPRDIEGTPRPAGGGVDIGAYEFEPSF